jgi:myo-inositol-1-phosphate synthase
MTSHNSESTSLLLMVAGAKGAVGSTLAAAIAAMERDPEVILPSLTTGDKFEYLGLPRAIRMVGWDKDNNSILSAIEAHGVLPETAWKPYQGSLEQMSLRGAPPPALVFSDQVKLLVDDIRAFKDQHPNAKAIFINLLPASTQMDLEECLSLSQLYSKVDPARFPDLPYALAAVLSGVPVVNFTPNDLEIPIVVDEAIERGIPICGRDGKTGQTYLKVVLASALKARSLYVNGWYSLNLLGNSDGKNLMDPDRAASKKANKTEVLDGILGYPVGEKEGSSCHNVHIDYYPPRGDAKEAWDVIDFHGMFGLPMSLRLNFQGRDSILAAPLVLDLARWMAALQMAGRSGPIPELAFYFKKPVGEDPPLSFQDQVSKLVDLEIECRQKVSSDRLENK